MSKQAKEYERGDLFRIEYLPPLGGFMHLQPFAVCKLCGKALSHNSGGHGGTYILAQSSHIAAHIRRGELIEETRERLESYTVYVRSGAS